MGRFFMDRREELRHADRESERIVEQIDVMRTDLAMDADGAAPTTRDLIEQAAQQLYLAQTHAARARIVLGAALEAEKDRTIGRAV